MDYYILIVIGLILLTFDSIYLYLLKDIFIKQIISVQKTNFKIDIVPAALCYILLILGLYYFIIKPKLSITHAFFLGILIYGVFETTNMAIFKNWTWKMVAIDTLWGGTLYAVTTYIIREFVV